jgi:hypothetical protein
MQAAAYTQMAIAYTFLGEPDKAEEMRLKADELDPH